MDAALLASLKVGLGIDALDTSQDAWLSLRGDGILTMMRGATGAPLSPPRRFRDVFHRGWCVNRSEGLTPRHGPIVEIESMSVGGLAIDITDIAVTTDNRVSLYGIPSAYNAEVELIYTAGFAELPGDLFDVLLMILQQLRSSTGGADLNTISKVSLVDVGSIEYKTSDTFDFTNMLGPFGVILDRYGGTMLVGGPLLVESYDLGEVAP